MLLGTQTGASPRPARYVSLRVLYQITSNKIYSSEQETGTIRLYDGRGNDTPLLTIDQLHRSPVHVMTVGPFYSNGTPQVIDMTIVQRSV